LEKAHIPSDFPFFTASGMTNKTTWSVSIILAVNKYVEDPIDWSAFKHDFKDWSEKFSPNLTISPTDLKFSERLAPSHSPRSCAHGMEGSTSVYQFFSLTPPHHEHLEEMIMKGVPIPIANLIYKIGKHNPLLSSLGILPNQLHNILKLCSSNFDEAFDDIGWTLFFHSYHLEISQKTDVKVLEEYRTRRMETLSSKEEKENLHNTGTRKLSIPIPFFRTSSKS
jgi:hypothetical protein